MSICVIGTGYVGLVAGVCFADTGQSVVCVDANPRIVEKLTAGQPTIYEPGLAEMLERNIHAGRLTFTTDLADAIGRCGTIFIAVGTPPQPSGDVDLGQVVAVANSIAAHADRSKVVVMKSTVPVGTCRLVSDIFAKHARVQLDYVSNPEFLKEGNAIEDFTKPDRVVIGAFNPKAAQIIADLYAPYMRQSQRILVTDPLSAEIAKYAANTMLAMRISFMNELSRLCEASGANVDDVRRCVGSDQRIGPAFLFPGLGYGGSCFPKDVQALIHIGQKYSTPMNLAVATHEANRAQVPYFQSLISRWADGKLAGRKIAVWGLAYKARTDDTRMSPAVEVVQWLLQQGAMVTAHDPQAIPNARKTLGDAVTYREQMYPTLDGADALLVLTDWQEYRNPDFEEVKRRLASAVVFDGRNLYNPRSLRDMGFVYTSIGRPTL
ncbi:MAG: UDP-glucose/GDP-mannose dehydrogenase family protein [Phycisphaerae bacterium]|nr:UDP-glucose/GDP-mannose dehydrogenase family protein [Phycisphaerae bacterium]